MIEFGEAMKRAAGFERSALDQHWSAVMNLHPIFAAALLASSSVVLAQTDATKQGSPTSAPAESSHAPGHDAQSGKPETGEKEKNDLAKK